jgi:hypothetical protein
MKKVPHIFFLFFMSCFPLLHAQIVINGAVVVNINGGLSATPIYLVLNTPPATPIKTIGTTGGIMMEGEYNMTKYNLGISTTNITVPYFSYNTGAGVQFPLSVTGISGAAISTATAGLQFSSKHAPIFASGYDNLAYVPSSVTDMNGWNAGIFTADNSINAIDRFWIIDALGYSTTPAVSYNFGYITAEAATNGGNTLTVANLAAEPWDQSVAAWAGSPTGNFPIGVNATGATIGNVSGVNLVAGLIGGANKYRSWTLVDNTNPLPVDLLKFSGACLNNGININWSTASESNSSYFTLEKSYDAQNFAWLANINAAGNSSRTKSYSHFDNKENKTVYYRLSEIDKNGDKKVFKVMTVNGGCNENGNETANIFSPDNQNVLINLTSLAEQNVSIKAYDVTGRLILDEVKAADMGTNNYELNANFVQGIYLFELKTNTNTIIKKVIIAN